MAQETVAKIEAGKPFVLTESFLASQKVGTASEVGGCKVLISTHVLHVTDSTGEKTKVYLGDQIELAGGKVKVTAKK